MSQDAASATRTHPCLSIVNSVVSDGTRAFSPIPNSEHHLPTLLFRYVAPEILNNEKYGIAVDMWSVGVIIFVILGGYPPFPQPTGNNMEELYKKICDGDFTFDPQWWGGVSQEAKDLIQGCLTVDVNKRLTAKQALDHEWFKAEGLENRDLGSALSELKKWNARRKLRAAVNTVIAINRVKNLIGRIKEGAKAEEEANKA